MASGSGIPCDSSQPDSRNFLTWAFLNTETKLTHCASSSIAMLTTTIFQEACSFDKIDIYNTSHADWLAWWDNCTGPPAALSLPGALWGRASPLCGLHLNAMHPGGDLQASASGKVFSHVQPTSNSRDASRPATSSSNCEPCQCQDFQTCAPAHRECCEVQNSNCRVYFLSSSPPGCSAMNLETS